MCSSCILFYLLKWFMSSFEKQKLSIIHPQNVFRQSKNSCPSVNYSDVCKYQYPKNIWQHYSCGVLSMRLILVSFSCFFKALSWWIRPKHLIILTPIYRKTCDWQGLFLFLLRLERGETSIWYSTCLCIHWLLLIRALMEYQT